MELANIDGRILPVQEATIPLMDRGFLFGDSVYEVIRSDNGRLLFADRHFARLRASADRIALEVPWSNAEIRERIDGTLAETGDVGERIYYVRIIVTRGVGSAPDIHPDYAVNPPCMIVLVRPLAPPDPRWYGEGLRAQIVGVRRNDRRALDPAIKSGNYLNNILGAIEAKRSSAEIAIFLNAEGKVTEAPTANVWIVKDGVVKTPPLEAGILAGITRAVLLEILEREGIPHEVCDLSADDLREADEVFLSSTIRDCAKIGWLDGHRVPKDEMTLRLRALVQEAGTE